MAINTIDDLRAHLALAAKVELSTIPPYLFAMYSIKDQQSDSARLIASVVVEEMLHVCLVTNLLLAIGGTPDFGYDTIPTYPSLMAHHTPDLLLELRACTPEQIKDVFMVIESPKAKDSRNESEEYETLGQFYGALEEALDELDNADEEQTIFWNHQPERQLSNASFYAPVKFDAEDSGGLILVHNAASADRAVEIIVDQGEGLSDHRWADPDHQELTHFYKFKQIADEETPIGDVWPVIDGLRTQDLPGDLQPASDLFNALYGLMYVTMTDLFSGTEDQSKVIERLYGLMSDCMAPTACYLVGLPVTGDTTAAPTFEVYRFEGDPWVETTYLAASVAHDNPELADVAATVATLRPGSPG